MDDDLLPFDKRKRPEYPETFERGTLSVKEKVRKIEDQNKCCAKCGCTPSTFEFDHTVPLWAGGDNSYENFRALCPLCHLGETKKGTGERSVMNRKRDKTSQWARRERKRPSMKVNKNGSVKVRQ